LVLDPCIWLAADGDSLPTTPTAAAVDLRLRVDAPRSLLNDSSSSFAWHFSFKSA
jgi:hypothetical protein